MLKIIFKDVSKYFNVSKGKGKKEQGNLFWKIKKTWVNDLIMHKQKKA